MIDLIIDWFYNQVKDFNFISSLLIPILIALIPAFMGSKFIHRENVLNNLRGRSLTVLENAQRKKGELLEIYKGFPARGLNYGSIKEQNERMHSLVEQQIDETKIIITRIDKAKRQNEFKQIAEKLHQLEKVDFWPVQ